MIVAKGRDEFFKAGVLHMLAEWFEFHQNSFEVIVTILKRPLASPGEPSQQAQKSRVWDQDEIAQNVGAVITLQEMILRKPFAQAYDRAQSVVRFDDATQAFFIRWTDSVDGPILAKFAVDAHRNLDFMVWVGEDKKPTENLEHYVWGGRILQLHAKLANNYGSNRRKFFKKIQHYTRFWAGFVEEVCEPNDCPPETIIRVKR